MLRRTIFHQQQRPGLSVIIAGATGNTGSELVTRLVSHKAVTRIVALTRKDISVDRWKQHFPNLRTTDALKYLSIVAVDWDRIFQDAMSVPASVLCSRPLQVESREEELMEIAWQERLNRKLLGGDKDADQQCHEDIVGTNSAANEAVDLWSNETFNLETVGEGGPSPSAVPTHRTRRSRGHYSPSKPTTNSSKAPSLRSKPTSSVDNTPNKRSRKKIDRNAITSGQRTSAGLSKSSMANGGASLPVVGQEHLITLQERIAVQTICQDPYYRSVFSGHNIAINCLGSHRVLWGSAVATVDLDYSMAFAKLVRLFNCVSITDAFLQDVTVATQRDSLRDYRSRRSLITEGSVEWGEIRSACFGKMVNVSFNSKSSKDKVTKSSDSISQESDDEKAYHKSAIDSNPPKKTSLTPEEDSVDFEINPFYTSPPKPSQSPLSEAEGQAHKEANQQARKRKLDYEERKADEAQLRHWDQAIERALRGRRHTAHTLHHFVQVSASGASESSRMTYFKVHGQCDQRMLSLYDYDLPSKPRNKLSSLLFGKGRAIIPTAQPLAAPTIPVPISSKESLLAPTLDHRADVTVFRPGLLARRNPTLIEKFLAFITPPMEVSALADVIVEDIMTKQAQIDAGLEAMKLLQQRLNEKYKYKLYVTRELGTPEWHVGLGPDTSFASFVSSAIPPYTADEDGIDTSPIPHHITTKTATSLVSPTISRVKIFEAVAREKAEIKSRLGVATGEVDDDDNSNSLDVLGGPLLSRRVGGMGSDSPLGSICPVCDLRARVGSVPTATIVGEREIRQRYARMIGPGLYRGSEPTVPSHHSGRLQEQLCHQS